MDTIPKYKNIPNKAATGILRIIGAANIVQPINICTPIFVKRWSLISIKRAFSPGAWVLLYLDKLATWAILRTGAAHIHGRPKSPLIDTNIPKMRNESAKKKTIQRKYIYTCYHYI